MANEGVLVKYPSGDEQGWVRCPVCQKTKLMTDRLVDANVSTLCGVCKNFYSVNLRTLKATKAKAATVRHKIKSYSKTK